MIKKIRASISEKILLIFLKEKEINQIRKSDPILNNKISYIKNKIKEIDSSFAF